MKIRSITYFCDGCFPLDGKAMAQAGDCLQRARAALLQAGYEVQTTRVALQPLGAVPGLAPSQLPEYALAVQAQLALNNIDYAGLGPVQLGDAQSYWAALPDVLAATQRIFTAGEIATRAGGVSLGSIQHAAQVALRNSRLTADGLGNLRFAALAGVAPGTPFLPAAFHAGGAPVFAVATEAADLAVTAFTGADSVAHACARLVAALELHGAQVQQALAALPHTFTGIDFSLAPFPEQSASIGVALEALGVAAVGGHGTLAAAALVADCVQHARFAHAGFSGLFLPLLEDQRLAQRGAEGMLTVNDLLLYSAVCGTGLDTIPLAGDIAAGELAAIMLDVAALALRLGKPLTARLMPIPGKRAGDPIEFDFPVFANGKVLAHKRGALSGALGGAEDFALRAR